MFRKRIFSCVLPVLFVLGLVLLSVAATAEDRLFEQPVDLPVPAMKPFKERPQRDKTTEFVLPEGFAIDRTFGEPLGLKVVARNLERMEEREFLVEPIENGVRLRWRVANGEVAPVGGRTARLTLQLRGIEIAKPTLSEDYNVLRKRLMDEYYFEGLIAQETWVHQDGVKAIKFADQPVYMGQMLAVLATEMAILRAGEKDASEARSRVLQILDAFDKLDLDADTKYGATVGSLDGFFLRDNVSGKDDPRLKGRFGHVESDGMHDAAADMDSPSGDQILGMLFGLWFVCHDSADPVLIRRAREIALRLYDYAHRCDFRLKRPDGSLNRRGAEMGWLATLTHGVARSITGQDRFGAARANIGGVEMKLQPIGAFWADKGLPALLNHFVDGRWSPRQNTLPLLPAVNLKPFTLHIILMATAIDDVWSDAAHEGLSLNARHEVAVLTRSHRTGRMPSSLKKGQVDQLLALCPKTGPAANLDRATGWTHDNRWVRCSDAYDVTSGSSSFNGLDWMLLHNLHQLVFVNGN